MSMVPQFGVGQHVDSSGVWAVVRVDDRVIVGDDVANAPRRVRSECSFLFEFVLANMLSQFISFPYFATLCRHIHAM